MITETRLTGPAHYPDQGSKPPLIGRFLQFIGMWVTLPGRKVIDRLMKKHSGFTLVELAVVMALVAILAAIAVPSYRAMIQNNRAATQANELVAALNLGRSEATRTGSTAVICPRPAAPTTPESCAAGTDWSNGWLLLSDPNGDGAFTPDGDGDGVECEFSEDCLLRVQQPPEGNPTITGPAVTFQGNGSAANSTITVRFPDCTGNQAQTITVLPAGRVSAAAGAC